VEVQLGLSAIRYPREHLLQIAPAVSLAYWQYWYHHIHHLSSVIPNYNLPKCFREQPLLSEYVTQIKFWPSLKMMKYKLWDEEQEKMISFSEYRQIKRWRWSA